MAQPDYKMKMIRENIHSILFISILFVSNIGLAQPGSGRDIPMEFRFKFYGKQGEIVTSNNDKYKIEIIFELPSYGYNDSVKFDNGYFSCVSFSGALVKINFITDNDTMKVHTTTSHDSIPFLKGNYIVSSEFAPIFSIIAHGSTKIKKQDWGNFRVDDFQETIFPNTLKKIDCQFWKNYKARIPLDFTPGIYGILYDPNFSSKIYAWDWNNLYVSSDKGKNWENILSVKEPYETPIVSFKDKNTLILFKTKKYQRPINKKPEVSLSKDGGLTWKIDLAYTKMGFYYAGFNNKKEGFAYSIKYFKEEKKTKTAFYVTKNGGKKWKETSRYNEKLFPLSTVYWRGKIIIVDGKLCTYSSFDEGENWDIVSNTFKYYQAFGNIYPSLFGSGLTHYLEIINNKNETVSKLLTIKNDWYVYFTATENIWCISGQRFTIISTDQGENWNYYFGSVAGSSIFTIIDDKFIFDGLNLYLIE